MSTAELAAAGWQRVDQIDRRSKLTARYQHSAGWTLEHCGHPTALHPYLLRDPQGRWVLTGMTGPQRRPDYGTAWWNLRQVCEWMATLSALELERGPSWFESNPGCECEVVL